MRLLLDTCTLIWCLAREEALTDRARRVIEDAQTEAFVSVVSLWEILVKHAQGKLRIASGTLGAHEFMMDQMALAGFSELPLAASDVRHVCHLPPVHRDPFDRLLICQAIENGLTLVTPDANIRRYPVKTLWN